MPSYKYGKSQKMIDAKMKHNIKKYMDFSKKSYNSFILGGDIGGTNTNLGIFGVKNNFPTLLQSLHFKSKELKDLSKAANEALSYAEKNYGIKITKACIAAAGFVSEKKDFITTQNVPWNVSKNNLLKKTKLKNILLINDFEAVGYGINLIGKKDICTIKKSQKIPKAPIVVIGAGTGLGKTTLHYNEQLKSYIPMPSEAGHTDFPSQSLQDLDLINFIKNYRKIKNSIPFEQVLSGNGIANIYLFLRKKGLFSKTKYSKDIYASNFNPEMISKYRKVDKICRETFEIFKRFYAIFARNSAIDSIALGGVYIAGGIASKNKDLFDKNFVKVFKQNYKVSDILRKIPIYLILNDNAGLLGAGFVGARYL